MKSKQAIKLIENGSWKDHYGPLFRDVVKSIEMAENDAEKRAIKAFEKLDFWPITIIDDKEYFYKAYNNIREKFITLITKNE